MLKGGILGLFFQMGTVQTRRIQTTEIAGGEDCTPAIIAPWQESTLNNTCSVEIASRYLW